MNSEKVGDLTLGYSGSMRPVAHAPSVDSGSVSVRLSMR